MEWGDITIWKDVMFLFVFYIPLMFMIFCELTNEVDFVYPIVISEASGLLIAYRINLEGW